MKLKPWARRYTLTSRTRSLDFPETAIRSQLKWQGDGVNWILLRKRRRVGRVVPDSRHPKMYSVRADRKLSDMANLTTFTSYGDVSSYQPDGNHAVICQCSPRYPKDSEAQVVGAKWVACPNSVLRTTAKTEQEVERGRNWRSDFCIGCALLRCSRPDVPWSRRIAMALYSAACDSDSLALSRSRLTSFITCADTSPTSARCAGATDPADFHAGAPLGVAGIGGIFWSCASTPLNDWAPHRGPVQMSRMVSRFGGKRAPARPILCLFQQRARSAGSRAGQNEAVYRIWWYDGFRTYPRRNFLSLRLRSWRQGVRQTTRTRAADRVATMATETIGRDLSYVAGVPLSPFDSDDELDLADEMTEATL